MADHRTVWADFNRRLQRVRPDDVLWWYAGEHVILDDREGLRAAGIIRGPWLSPITGETLIEIDVVPDSYTYYEMEDNDRG